MQIIQRIKNNYRILLFIMISGVIMSCSSKDNDSEAYKVIRYELTGTFSGELVITRNFDARNGSGTNMNVVEKLPWKTDFSHYGPFTTTVNVKNSTMGKEGENVKLSIYVDNKEVKTETAEADKEGNVEMKDVVYVQH